MEGEAGSVASGLPWVAADGVGEESAHMLEVGHGVRVGIKAKGSSRIEEGLLKENITFADGVFLIKPHAAPPAGQRPARRRTPVSNRGVF